MEAVRLEDTRPLTTLRLLAAYHVLLLHESLDRIQGAPAILNELLERTAAVSLFFFLSGLLMTLGRGNKPWVAGDAKRFLRRRLAKTQPLYYIGLFAFLPIFLGRTYLAPEPNWGQAGIALLVNLVHLQSWVPNMAEPWYINRPGWTIGTFLAFYLVFPWIHRGVLRLSTGGRAALFWWMLVTSMAFVWIMENRVGIEGRDLELLHKFPPLRLPEFVMGVAMGGWVLGRGGVPRTSRWTALVVGSTLIGLFVLLPGSWSNYIHNGLLMPGFAVLVIALTQPQVGVGWMSNAFLLRLGEASFTLYILHLPFANYLSGVLQAVGLDLRFTPLFILLDTLLLIPLTLWIYERVEEPLRLRLLGRRP